MKKTILLGVAMAIAGAAFAYPSLLGPTGGATLPTADTAVQGQFNVAVNYLFDGNTDTYDIAEGVTESDDFSDTLNIALLYGITPNFEIGANYNNQKVDWSATNGVETIAGDENLSNWGLNAKYAFNNVYVDTNVALGALYQNYDQNDQTAYQLYAVATKAFTEASEDAVGFRGSLGVNYTSFSRTITMIDGDGDLVDVDVDNNATRVFAVLDATFANNLSLLAEYQTKNNDFESDAMSSIAVRYLFIPSLTGQVAYTNSYRGVAGGEDHNLMIGLNYAFGGATE